MIISTMCHNEFIRQCVNHIIYLTISLRFIGIQPNENHSKAKKNRARKIKKALKQGDKEASAGP